MSEVIEATGTLRPPDSTAPATVRRTVSAPPRNKTVNKVRFAVFLSRGIRKLLNGIKNRSARQLPTSTHQPCSLPTGINPPGNAAFPNYGRFSEKLSAALSSNTNSASSVARGGSDSELPVFRNISSLPSGDSPTTTRSPLWSPSSLGASSLGPVKFHHVLNPPPEDAVALNPVGLIRCRTSPCKPAAAVGAPGRQDAAAVASFAAARALSCETREPQPQKHHAPSPGSLFSCLIGMGDPHAACDRPVTTNHLNGHRQNQQQRQQQQQPPQSTQVASALPPNVALVDVTVRSLLTCGSSSSPSSAAAVAAAAAPLPASLSHTTGQLTAWNAEHGTRMSSGMTPFTRSNGSDSVLQVGCFKDGTTAFSRVHGAFQCPPLQQHQQPISLHLHLQEQYQQDPPRLRTLIQPRQGACTIQSPGGTPRAGSPVGSSWLTHGSAKQFTPAMSGCDWPSAARQLAYRPPEAGPPARPPRQLATRAGGGGGCGGGGYGGGGAAATAAAGRGVEGRVRGGQGAAAALQRGAEGLYVSAGTSSSGRGFGRPAPVQRVVSVLESAHSREMAASQRLVAAAEAATAAAAAAAAAASAAASAAAVPSVVKAELIIRGQLDPMLTIPFQSCGGGVASNGGWRGGDGIGAIGTASAQVESPCTSATVVGPSSASSSSCTLYDSRTNSHAVGGLAASNVTNGAAGATTLSAAVAGAASGRENDTCTHLSENARPQQAVAVGGSSGGDGIQKRQHSEAATPPSQILALNPDLPAGMRRSRWSLEDYTVTKRLYKGSTSAVYKAICNRSGLKVALKVYFLNRVPAAVLHMICREIEIHAAVAHPNILMLYAAFQCDRHLTLVLEYAPRGDLYGIQQSCINRRLDERQVADLVLAPLLDAVSYLHSHGYCHRDIKPENVLFTSDWRLKLADFGVSIDLSKERAVTRAGTVSYMAPEVARCPLKFKPDDNKEDPDLAYGTACDVWALGVMTYELLVGFTPLGAPAGGQEATRPALIFPAGISQASRAFVAWALAERPTDRPSAQQLRLHPWMVRPSTSPSTGFAPSTPRATSTDVVTEDKA